MEHKKTEGKTSAKPDPKIDSNAEQYIIPEPTNPYLMPDRSATIIPEEVWDEISNPAFDDAENVDEQAKAQPDQTDTYLMPDRNSTNITPDPYLIPDRVSGEISDEISKPVLDGKQNADRQTLSDQNDTYLMPDRTDTYLMPDRTDTYLMPDRNSTNITPDPYLIPDRISEEVSDEITNPTFDATENIDEQDRPDHIYEDLDNFRPIQSNSSQFTAEDRAIAETYLDPVES